MNKVMNVVLIVLVLFTVVSTLKAFRDLNDGRIATVVNQLVKPQVQDAQAKEVNK